MSQHWVILFVQSFVPQRMWPLSGSRAVPDSIPQWIRRVSDRLPFNVKIECGIRFLYHKTRSFTLITAHVSVWIDGWTYLFWNRNKYLFKILKSRLNNFWIPIPYFPGKIPLNLAHSWIVCNIIAVGVVVCKQKMARYWLLKIRNTHFSSKIYIYKYLYEIE